MLRGLGRDFKEHLNKVWACGVLNEKVDVCVLSPSNEKIGVLLHSDAQGFHSPLMEA